MGKHAIPRPLLPHLFQNHNYKIVILEEEVCSLRNYRFRQRKTYTGRDSEKISKAYQGRWAEEKKMELTKFAGGIPVEIPARVREVVEDGTRAVAKRAVLSKMHEALGLALNYICDNCSKLDRYTEAWHKAVSLRSAKMAEYNVIEGYLNLLLAEEIEAGTWGKGLYLSSSQTKEGRSRCIAKAASSFAAAALLQTGEWIEPIYEGIGWNDALGVLASLIEDYINQAE